MRRQSIARVRASLAIGCCSLIGCSSMSSAPHPAACIRSVTVTVISSFATTAPRIGWTPRCGVSNLTVTTVPFPGAAPAVMWGFSTPENAPIGPSVTYGETPEGAVAWPAPQPLVRGTRYRVTVMYTVGGDAITGWGEETFTR